MSGGANQCFGQMTFRHSVPRLNQEKVWSNGIVCQILNVLHRIVRELTCFFSYELGIWILDLVRHADFVDDDMKLDVTRITPSF